MNDIAVNETLEGALAALSLACVCFCDHYKHMSDVETPFPKEFQAYS